MLINTEYTEFNRQCIAGSPPPAIPNMPGSYLIPVENGRALFNGNVWGVSIPRTTAFNNLPVPHDPDPVTLAGRIKVRVIVAYFSPRPTSSDTESLLGMIETQTDNGAWKNEGWYVLEMVLAAPVDQEGDKTGQNPGDVCDPVLNLIDQGVILTPLEISGNLAVYEGNYYGLKFTRTQLCKRLKELAAKSRNHAARLAVLGTYSGRHYVPGAVAFVTSAYYSPVDPTGKTESGVVIGYVWSRYQDERAEGEGWFVLDKIEVAGAGHGS